MKIICTLVNYQGQKQKNIHSDTRRSETNVHAHVLSVHVYICLLVQTCKNIVDCKLSKPFY